MLRWNNIMYVERRWIFKKSNQINSRCIKSGWYTLLWMNMALYWNGFYSACINTECERSLLEFNEDQFRTLSSGKLVSANGKTHWIWCTDLTIPESPYVITSYQNHGYVNHTYLHHILMFSHCLLWVGAKKIGKILRNCEEKFLANRLHSSKRVFQPKKIICVTNASLCVENYLYRLS